MKSAVSLFLFVYVIFTASISFAVGGTSVGNGGFGVWKNGSFQLFDLAEADVTPKRSHINDALLHPKLKDIAQKLQIEEALLASKTAELNQLIPGFGILIAEVISFYEWKIEPQISNHTRDACQGCIQIAIRSARAVVVNWEVWQIMNQDQRIALMIHEAAFALMRTGRCRSPGAIVACEEADFKAVRGLVAQLFDGPTKNKNTAMQAIDLIRKTLKIGHPSLMCTSPYAAQYERADGKVVELESVIRPEARQIERFAEAVCDSLGTNEVVQLTILRMPWKLESVPRFTIYGQQYFLELLNRSILKSETFLSSNNFEECWQKVTTSVNTWFDGTSIKPGSSCY